MGVPFLYSLQIARIPGKQEYLQEESGNRLHSPLPKHPHNRKRGAHLLLILVLIDAIQRVPTPLKGGQRADGIRCRLLEVFFFSLLSHEATSFNFRFHHHGLRHGH